MGEIRRLAVLGSTGSIGVQALEVAALHAERFQVVALVARSSAEQLFAQVARFRPLLAGLTGEGFSLSDIPADLRFCRWVFGQEALAAAATLPEADAVLVSVVGMCGLESVLTRFTTKSACCWLTRKRLWLAGGL